MPGILYYNQYLDTLRSTNDFISIFPSNQRTYTTQVQGTSTYSVTASWITLIVDPVAWYADGSPNFFNSQVIGYFEGGTTSQFSTGVISLPQYLYTGPILPTQERNVPVTIVQVQYNTGGQTYHHRFGLIQNYEPGVTIADPTESQNYTPIILREPSFLTLTITPSTILYSNSATFTLISSIPFILPINTATFWLEKAGADEIIGFGTFQNYVNPSTGENQSRSIFTYNSLGGPLSTGTNYVYATFPGVRNYTSSTSNTASLEIIAGTPLSVFEQYITPSQNAYFTGTTASYYLKLIPNPSFGPRNDPVINQITVKYTDRFQPVPLINDEILTITNLTSGTVIVPLTFTNSLVDLNVINPNTQVTLTTSTKIGNNFSATFSISNTHRIESQWENDFVNRYTQGSTSLVFTATGNKNLLITGRPFAITISQTRTPVVQTEQFGVNLNAADFPFNQPITLYASKAGSTSTLATFTYNANNPSNNFSTLVSFAQTGTYNIYASYPGDSLYYTSTVNLSTTSNILTQTVVQGNNLSLYSDFVRNTNDVITVYATFNGTLTGFVSFYEGTSFLGTASWVRQIISISTVTTFLDLPAQSNQPLSNYNRIPFGTPYWTTDFDNVIDNKYGWDARVQLLQKGPYQNINYPFNFWPNYYSLLRYKSPSESNESWLSNPVDIVSTVTRHIKTLGPEGYNVIGIAQDYNLMFQDPVPPYIPTSNPPLANFPRPFIIGNETFYAEEYIGTIGTWQAPYYRYVHYYRFSPQIPASGTTWNLQRDYGKLNPLDVPNLTMLSFGRNLENNSGPIMGESTQINTSVDRFPWIMPRFAPNGGNRITDSGTPMSIQFRIFNPNQPQAGGIRPGSYYWDYSSDKIWYLQFYRTYYWIQYPNYTVDHTAYRQVYQDFGRQLWTSQDFNDVNQNALARKANTWFSAMTTQGSQMTLPAYTLYSTVTNVTYSNLHIARLVLPPNTVVDPYNLTATWPGSIGQGSEYGEFFPFNIQITYNN